MFDVIVGGGGPAGAVAAASLARRGLKILVLERSAMPRSKPCGGIVPAAVLDMTNITAEDAGATVITSLTFTWRGKEPVAIALPPEGIFSVQREKFDEALLVQAKAAGAQVKEDSAVTEIIEIDEYVRVVDGQGCAYEGKRLLLAWGGQPPLPGMFRRRARRRSAVSGICALPSPASGDFAHAAWLDLGVLESGYAGIIDKGSHLLLGYYVRQPKLPRHFREALASYCGALGLPFDGALLAHRVLPLYDRSTQFASERTLLLGDAAALVDPLSGEGIRHALKSGLIAAETLGESLEAGGQAARYGERIRKEIGDELDIAWKLSTLAYGFPRIAQVGMARVGSEAVHVLNGRETYRHLLERLKQRIRRTLGLCR